MGTSQLLGDKERGANMRYTTVRSSKGRNIDSLFMLLKPEISTGTGELLAHPSSVGWTDLIFFLALVSLFN